MESEMLFILVLALIVLGPRKLPEIGRQIGRALAEFRRAKNEFARQIEDEIRRVEVEEKQKMVAPAENNPTQAKSGLEWGTKAEQNPTQAKSGLEWGTDAEQNPTQAKSGLEWGTKAEQNPTQAKSGVEWGTNTPTDSNAPEENRIKMPSAPPAGTIANAPEVKAVAAAGQEQG
jgi:Tat protein translocase TatB subunit